MSTDHLDTRTNLPTPDGVEDFGTPELDEVRQVRYPRDPTLDPQLVWRGKDEQDSADLVADAPPIYVQEKIDPRAIIEQFRSDVSMEPLLFEGYEGFDGLDPLSAVDYYHHHADWANRMILGDSLRVMASLAEREELRGKVQMVYIDPPYGIKFGSNWQASARKRDVKDGKLEDAAREAEQIKAFRDTWELGIHSYLSYLRDRLVAARELLTESGSCFVQIGDENVHLVRSLMDEVFGSENFVSLITFATTSGFSQANTLGRMGDYAIWYAKRASSTKSRALWRRATERQGYNWILEQDGSTRGMTAAERAGDEQLPPDARVYQPDNLVSQGASQNPQPFEYLARTYAPGATSHWKAGYPEGMQRIALAGRLHVAKNSLRYIRFPDDFGFQSFNNTWTDTATGNFTDDKVYVVQSGSKTIERCMLMCTDPGDLVVDPTCGSGTTAYVAEQWGRRWITIDTSRVALTLARQRMMGARFPYYLLADSIQGRTKEEQVSGKQLPSAQVTNDIRHGFVYERVQHITLKSIANNPDIVEGMTREQIDEAIKRHADFEVLYDRPYEDSSKIRVASKFTVESLSPHRSLAFAGGTDGAPPESISEQSAALDPSSVNFEQSILDNLAKAGIQNGRRNERITFASLDSYAGRYLQAIGEQAADADNDEPGEGVGIAIGPQYGTVSAAFIRDAAREAIRTKAVDLLCVLGFAFDANANDVTEADGITVETVDEVPSGDFAEVADERTIGRIRVLLVRMNVDLLMGEDLKKTGAGNLFTVFGEPDIEVRDAPDGKLIVELKGVDVYDPTTGETRHDNTGGIALWMVDTAYNEESFYVRHCYFTGGGDPYKKLKTALKAEIDPDGWEALYRTESRPFDRPSTGKIAVKVINDYGDEVMKVYEV